MSNWIVSIINFLLFLFCFTYPGINVRAVRYQNAQDINMSSASSQMYAAFTCKDKKEILINKIALSKYIKHHCALHL